MKCDRKRKHPRAPAPFTAHGTGGGKRDKRPPQTVARGGADALENPGGKEQYDKKSEKARLRAHRDALYAPLCRPRHRDLGKNTEVFK